GPFLVPTAPAAPSPAATKAGRAFALACGAAFIGLLVGLPILAARAPDSALALADAFYRTGALVFGGGHVVLPLLETEMTGSGWMSASDVLTGYAAAQALPGPLFALSAYLGAAATAGPGGLAGAAIATLAIFAPGLLILLAAEPFWALLRATPLAQRAVAGANAAVVGLLAAALVGPIAQSALPRWSDALASRKRRRWLSWRSALRSALRSRRSRYRSRRGYRPGEARATASLKRRGSAGASGSPSRRAAISSSVSFWARAGSVSFPPPLSWT
ncbi:MAG: hypothetical protein EBZ50_10325, partial [Alphaproteobacteria bacterium]|nr:hypothetical protein [Alphaproteobacteria bacterium]